MICAAGVQIPVVGCDAAFEHRVCSHSSRYTTYFIITWPRCRTFWPANLVMHNSAYFTITRCIVLCLNVTVETFSPPWSDFIFAFACLHVIWRGNSHRTVTWWTWHGLELKDNSFHSSSSSHLSHHALLISLHVTTTYLLAMLTSTSRLHYALHFACLYTVCNNFVKPSFTLIIFDIHVLQ